MNDFIKKEKSRFFIRFIFTDKKEYFQQSEKIEKFLKKKQDFSSNLIQLILPRQKKYFYCHELTSFINTKSQLMASQIYYFQFISFDMVFDLKKMISWHKQIEKLNKDFHKKSDNTFFTNCGYINEEQVVSFYSYFLPDRIYFQKELFLKNELILKNKRLQPLDLTSQDFSLKDSRVFFEDLQKLIVFN